jgi:sensor histidine kinase regulating citrate/malate metabolism
LSIRTRIILTLALVQAISLFLVVGLSGYFLHTQTNLQQHESMHTTADLSAAVLTDAVIANDVKRIDLTVAKLIDANYGAIRICVFNKAGARLSSCRCRSLDEKAHPNESIVEVQLTNGGETIGSVGVAFIHAHSSDALAQIRWEVALLAFCCLIVGVVAAWWVGDTLTAQVNAITSALEAAVHEKPVPVLKSNGRTSELDQVASAFNALVAKRRKSDAV